MELLLDRFDRSGDRTIGKLYADGCFQAYTCEDPVRQIAADGSGKVKGQTAIPAGRYRVVIDHSQHFGKDLPHILDVPHFEGVRIHAGNSTVDTEGCILVGLGRLTNTITSSRLALQNIQGRIAATLATGGEVHITVQ